MKTINKNGDVTKAYTRKLWNFAVSLSVDCVNGDVSDEQLEEKIEEFKEMVNKIAEEARMF